MSGNNILITGNDGFIGSSLLSEIKSAYSEIFDEIYLFEKSDIDINSQWADDLKNLVSKSNTIIHIGADSSTQNPNFNEVLFYNYYFSKKLFDFVEGSDKKVIYSSSAACYGVDGFPSTIYGWSKYLAEQYGVAKVKNFYALRYFNVYGPGESHKGKMASVACQVLSSKQDPFKLFPGKPKRDFVYIKDIVSANIHPILQETRPGVYDVGTGEQHTFEKVLDLLGRDYEYFEETSIPENYQFSTLASKEKFMEGWSPKFNLETGIKQYKESYS